jgi:hypothetical protein
MVRTGAHTGGTQHDTQKTQRVVLCTSKKIASAKAECSWADVKRELNRSRERPGPEGFVHGFQHPHPTRSAQPLV